MNGHRKESTGNQKAGWLAPSILSARTSYSQWERVVLCAIYYFPDPVGGVKHCAINSERTPILLPTGA